MEDGEEEDNSCCRMKDESSVSRGTNICTSFDALRQVDRSNKALP